MTIKEIKEWIKYAKNSKLPKWAKELIKELWRTTNAKN